MVEKFSDRFSCFDTIPACDGHPARHVAVARTPLTTSRGKKRRFRWFGHVEQYMIITVFNVMYNVGH